MIIINLTGGLGNQMFQYAFGRCIAEKYQTNLKLHYTTALFNTKRSYELGVFKIKATIASPKDLQNFGIVQDRGLNRLLYILDERYGLQFNSHIVTQRYPYSFDAKYLGIKNDSYIQGFWADERYFKRVKDIIREEFVPKDRLDLRNQKTLRRIKNTQSVSIHVRRGDYITNKTNARVFGFLGLDYYKNSIKKIKRLVFNPVFFVFSDDIPWCKENLACLIGNAEYIDCNKGIKSYKDILLMSGCKHNIIANSSFSWWGRWLNIHRIKSS